jgi:integrase
LLFGHLHDQAIRANLCLLQRGFCRSLRGACGRHSGVGAGNGIDQRRPLGSNQRLGMGLPSRERCFPSVQERAGDLRRQLRQVRVTGVSLGQCIPPGLEQLTYAGGTAASELSTHALDGGALAARQDAIGGGENLGFRDSYGHALLRPELGTIRKRYPTWSVTYRDIDTVDVMKSSMTPRLLDAFPMLDPGALSAASLRAAAELVAEGTPANTARSYASALRYWAAWLQGRYALPLGDAPLPSPVVAQFVLDHLPRRTKAGLQHELPPALDAALVAARAKGKPGPLTFNTVAHRLAVLGQWHALRGWPNPVKDAAVVTLVKKARAAQVRRGVTVRKKTAAVREPLEAMLATCTDGLRGVRDRALLLLAWSGGGRRRSEVVGLQVTDLRQVDAQTWVYTLGVTKTNTSGVAREKPLQGPVVVAIEAWLVASQLTVGPLFRRLHRGGTVGRAALSDDHVARIVQRRAQLAGIKGDWAAHSLRSGFVTEAGRQGVPLGEVMAMTEHRSVGTVMGYFQTGTLLTSRASDLLAGDPMNRRADAPKSADSESK